MSIQFSPALFMYYYSKFGDYYVNSLFRGIYYIYPYINIIKHYTNIVGAALALQHFLIRD